MDSGPGSVLRDGRSGRLACALLPPPRCPSRSPGVVRASSLWLVLRIQRLFLPLTETWVLHVLDVDGVSALLGMSGGDLFVTLGSFEWWPALVCVGVSASVGRIQS